MTRERNTVQLAYDSVVRDDSKDDAFLLKMDEREIWFPRSKCKLDEDDGYVEMPDWLAYKEELI